MIGEAIIHVGMHKTGSSSIQAALSELECTSNSEIVFLKLNSPNHSEFLMTLLLPDPEKYHAHRLRGRSREEVFKIRSRYQEVLDAKLKSFSCKKIIISAEDLSAPGVTVEMLENLKEILLEYCESIRVIGYVRPPVAYMKSAFQERLKNAVITEFDFRSLWPNYKLRFDSLDKVFGESCIELVPFLQMDFPGESVVFDFGQRVGLDLEGRHLIRANESLSLEATALLFTMRHFEVKEGYDGFSKDNDIFNKVLSSIGKTPLNFSRELIAPLLKEKEEDLDWINQRLGRVITDDQIRSELAVGSESDLFSIAMQNQNAVLDLLWSSTSSLGESHRVAELIDYLYLLAHRGSISYRRLGVSEDDSLTAFLNDKQSPSEILLQASMVFSQTESELAALFREAAERAERLLDSKGGRHTPSKAQVKEDDN